MNFLNKYLLLFCLGMLAVACQDDFLDPEQDNALTEEQVIENPTLAEGILLKAYQGLPGDIFDQLDLAVASDEATTNDINSNALRIATGGWQAADNPISKWDNAYKNIQYINLFLENVNNVRWDLQSDDLNRLHASRLTGEAYGLRAYYQFLLLQQHAGLSNDGNLLGFPINTKVLDANDPDLFKGRNTFQECVDQIINDCNLAISSIVASYENFSTGKALEGRIEAEDYDSGGQGVGYNDTTEGNNGNQYRDENVDIEVSMQGENNFNLGWTTDGEWLNYSFERIFEGRYDISLSLASNSNNIGQVRVSVGSDENSLIEVGVFQAERTGWQGWAEYTIEGVELEGGFDQLVRIEFVGGNVNFDYFVFEKVDGPIQETALFNGEEFLVTELNLAQGERWKNRFSGNAARAIKSRVELYAASPAYNKNSNVTWDDAAKTSGQFLQDVGGLSIVDEEGLTFYLSPDSKDIIWRNSLSNKSNWEEANFPPSQFGRGETNPSQNLVDAFPMSNGYPITDPNSGYNANLPYIGRDARLNAYVLFNGSSFKNGIINTYEGADLDGINTLISSTRTGYYLKKFMNEGVNLAVGSQVQARHFMVYFRFTEIMLNYAEAANEAYGPDGDPNGFGFTARDVVSALRGRAGISQPDPYLSSLNTTEAFRELIRNERRLELAFEGHRFWDLRRWNETSVIKEPIEGIFFAENQFDFTVREIENRPYQDYMIYGPIPLDEVLKNTNLQQNQGW